MSQHNNPQVEVKVEQPQTVYTYEVALSAQKYQSKGKKEGFDPIKPGPSFFYWNVPLCNHSAPAGIGFKTTVSSTIKVFNGKQLDHAAAKTLITSLGVKPTSGCAELGGSLLSPLETGIQYATGYTLEVGGAGAIGFTAWFVTGCGSPCVILGGVATVVKTLLTPITLPLSWIAGKMQECCCSKVRPLDRIDDAMDWCSGSPVPTDFRVTLLSEETRFPVVYASPTSALDHYLPASRGSSSQSTPVQQPDVAIELAAPSLSLTHP